MSMISCDSSEFQSGKDLHVLVVEDEAVIGMLIEDMLNDLGCTKVSVVACVDRALELLATEEPDFAMLDVNLNGRRSYPVADLLKARGVPFVFLSGYGPHGLEPPYTSASLLQKPFQMNDLAAMLRKTFPGFEGARPV